jgi:hypothetical protein
MMYVKLNIKVRFFTELVLSGDSSVAEFILRQLRSFATLRMTRCEGLRMTGRGLRMTGGKGSGRQMDRFRMAGEVDH